jgi:hypothetical protein
LFSGECFAFFPPALQLAIEQIFHGAPFESPKESKKSKTLAAMFSQVLKRGSRAEVNCQTEFSVNDSSHDPAISDLSTPHDFDVNKVNFKALGHYLSTFSPEARTVLYYFMSQKTKIFGSSRFYYPTESTTGLFFDSEGRIISGQKFRSAINELFTEPPVDDSIKRQKI